MLLADGFGWVVENGGEVVCAAAKPTMLHADTEQGEEMTLHVVLPSA